MRLLSDTRSRRLNLPGQCHILRCRWYWKAVCPAPDINRKRTCTPTCKAACRSVPPPWRTAAQSLLHPARRGRAIFISRGILQCAGTSTEAMKATNTEYSTWALHKFQSPMPTKPYLFLIATSHTLFNPMFINKDSQSIPYQKADTNYTPHKSSNNITTKEKT